MKGRTYAALAAGTAAALLLSLQLVYGAFPGGHLDGSDNMNPQTPTALIVRTRVVPGSEPGTFDLRVTAGAMNFRVADMQGEGNLPKTGHIHFYLDARPAGGPAQPAIPPEGTLWAHAAGKTHTFAGLSPGRYTVYVELVNNDHTSLDPLARARKRVNIKG